MKVISLFFYLFLSIVSYCQLFTFRNFNHKNGLSLSSVTSIAQDNKGNILIGTDGAGIQKFDGYTITNLTQNTLDNEHHVTSMDPVDRSIYFSSRFKGFYKYCDGTYEKINFRKTDNSENLGIKKNKNSLVIVESSKITILLKDKVIAKKSFKIPTASIVQFQKVQDLVIILTEFESFIVSENKIYSLNNWLKIKEEVQLDFVSIDRNSIHCFSRRENIKFVVKLLKNSKISVIKKEVFLHPKIGKIVQVYSKNHQLIVLDSLNNLFYSLKNKLKLLPKNYSVKTVSLHSVFIDKNFDFWATSTTNGFFKVSEEPFSKVDLHPVYQNHLISFIYKNDYNEVFISDFNDQTYIGSFQSTTFQKHDFKIYGQTIFQDKQLFATSEGIFVYIRSGKFEKFNNISGKIIFIYAVDDVLFYCLAEKGLIKFENNQTVSLFQNSDVSHIYTAQINRFKTKVYFGTNSGIYSYNIASKKIQYVVPQFKVQGGYSGVSTTDCFGTIWFSLDKKIVGITKNEEYRVLDNPEYFNSTLFYTLNSDAFGNLWIGTNKGITRLKVNAYGHVEFKNFYQKVNGFDGYETHMRSSFQQNNLIFIGTIEGLFVINPICFEKIKTPPQPFVYQTNIKNSKHTVYDEDLIRINFISINPKNLGIKYTYRLKGKNNVWSNLSNQTSAYFANLTDQEYIFEVRSSYDGISFSKTSSYQLVVHNPFWKSSWFILCLIIAITLGNFIVLDRSKNFDFNTGYEQNSMIASNRMKTMILIFGFISTTFTYFFASSLDHSIPKTTFTNVSLALILGFLIVISTSKNKFSNLKNYTLIIAFYSVLFHAYFGAYVSTINPFYVVIICLCSSLAPIILSSFKQVILFSIFQILVASSFVLIMDNSIYNEILFLIALLISVTITVFHSYIKNESFEKLIFTSSLLNKTQMMVISFDENQRINYVNETFSKLFKAKFLVDADLSQLMTYVHKSLLNQTNILNEIRSKEQLLLPMKTKDGIFIWVDWKITKVSKKKWAMFGQNITEEIFLKEEKQRLASISSQLIYFVDIQSKILEFNQAFKNLFGEEKSFINYDSLLLVHEEDVSMVKSFYENQFKSKIHETKLDFRVLDKHNNVRILSQKTELVFVKGSDKLIKGFYSVATDVTHLQELQTKLNKQNFKQQTDYSELRQIQNLYFPEKEKFNSIFSDSALLFKPKDIITNDLYWLEKVENTSYVIIGQNNLHGVSASIISYFTNFIASQIILEEKLTDPAEILTAIEKRLIKQFPSLFEEKKINLELTVFTLNGVKKEIHYASSGGKFISLLNGEPTVHRGESKRLGELLNSRSFKYNTYDLIYNKIDYLVFFTDGITNQINRKLNKPFSLKRLLDHFKQHHQLTFQEQLDTLNELFEKWKDTGDQEEDVTVIAIKF